MSTLQETLARLDALIAERGLSREETLDPVALARSTALSEETVRALLNGESVPEEDIDQRVVKRVRALFLARLVETGKSRTRLCNEAAAQMEISGEWARLLLNGEKVPNVKLLAGLEEFFGVEPGSFQCTAVDALSRVLRPILSGLEVDSETSADPMTDLMDRFNIVSMARRGKPATPHQAAMMAQFIVAVLESGPEEDR
ncbi:hypothetical protein N8I84_41455 (plasmid) [Streptomyces cynarae]|uniref:Helix-turn-helix transcriptional regulator n=1 Tax=Streptomyces cynarae TaxID=2981134 RepID=A0ABY6EDW9_9ACTN|nr:hypothetical protein [Streptomyces cynarae]UXY24916.1 hypothetical protein N8I84_41455 [Streptomyces cynarae]